jgi:hypothetical protein
MKIKSFWNRERKLLTTDQILAERKLLPRLKLMGYLFFGLSIASLLFIFLANESSTITPMIDETLNIPLLEDDTIDELDLNPFEVLNFYVISFIFAAIGAACLYITKIKKRQLFQENPLSKD